MEETLFLITLFILCNFCFFSGCVLLAIKNKNKIKKKTNKQTKGTNPQLTYSRAGKNLLVLWANSSLIFLAQGHFLPAPWTELNNNNNNNNGLLTDPLGGSSLLKYINYNFKKRQINQIKMLLNQKEMKVMFLNNGHKQVSLDISNYKH